MGFQIFGTTHLTHPKENAVIEQLAPRLLSFASEVDEGTIEQARNTASMPFVHPHVALMPDAHFGKGSSVGTVIPTLGAVIPAAVGVDIGCGMIAVRTRFNAADIEGRDLAKLRESIESAIPMSKGGYNRSYDRFTFTRPRINDLEILAHKSGVDPDSYAGNWRLQLGTLGGGNHFIELCLDDLGAVWLFLHSGSRGVGNKIAVKHIKVAQALMREFWIDLPDPELAYLPQHTKQFTEYIRDLVWAQHFALLNRAEMMDRFRRAFTYWLGLDPDTDADGIELERINTHHNYTRMEKHGGRDVWLTRKGAIDAHEGVMGLIPGSMGTSSYVVRGKGNPAGLCSAPHGAGRRYSRTKARQLFTADDLAARMEGIEYRHGDAWVDEIPDAYKPIDVVMADAEPLVEVVAKLRQVLNVKGE